MISEEQRKQNLIESYNKGFIKMSALVVMEVKLTVRADNTVEADDKFNRMLLSRLESVGLNESVRDIEPHTYLKVDINGKDIANVCKEGQEPCSDCVLHKGEYHCTANCYPRAKGVTKSLYM